MRLMNYCSRAQLVVRNASKPPWFCFSKSQLSLTSSDSHSLFFQGHKCHIWSFMQVIGCQLTTHRICMTWGQRRGRKGSLLALYKPAICSKTLPLRHCWFIKIKIERLYLTQPAILKVSSRRTKIQPQYQPTPESVSQKLSCNSSFLLNFLHVFLKSSWPRWSTADQKRLTCSKDYQMYCLDITTSDWTAKTEGCERKQLYYSWGNRPAEL